MIVTVDEVKTHLRIQHDEEDAYLTGLIVQAQGRRRITAGHSFLIPRPNLCGWRFCSWWASTMRIGISPT